MSDDLKKNTRLFCLFLAAMIFTFGNARAQAPLSGGEKRNAVPRVESANCPVEIPNGVKAECFDLFVRENRARSESRIIKLPFIVVKSTAANPAPDPVLYTGGGPGAGSLNRARRADNLVPFTAERDFIIFEQRGTERAEPSLQCPEVKSANQSSAARNLSDEEARRSEVRAAKLCRDRLARAGVDLAAYNSAASAADIEDLRRALKIERLNLYGISYSTRLMLNYIRAYPNGARSVILDSVLPPTVNWDERDVDGIMGALNLIFSDCARDAECAAAYPELEKTFDALLEAANRKPVVIEVAKDGKTHPVKFDANAIFDFVYNLLEDGSALAKIPAIISALGKGDYRALKPYAENKLSGGGFIWGMRYSVWCGEEMPFQDRRKIAAQATKYSRIKGFKVQGALPEICRVWNVPAAAAIENQPVTSDLPALIFSGQYDPDTPPAWGRLVASWFPNGYFYEVRGASHGAISNRCTFVEMAAEFVKNPHAAPNAACLAKIPPLDFK